MEKLHLVNLTIHVLAGTVALVAGLAAAFVNKGGKRHMQFGRYFWRMIVIVIITGLMGILVFKRNNFLLVITMLSGYNCFSGIRAVRLRGQKPGWVDYLVPVAVMASGLYYLYYIRSAGLYWSPVIVYSTLGALFMVTVYDLCKFMMPVSFLKKAVMYEHSDKMISALSAIASAFVGTVFPQYKPYSQFLPSVIGFSCIIISFIVLGMRGGVVKGQGLISA